MDWFQLMTRRNPFGSGVRDYITSSLTRRRVVGVYLHFGTRREKSLLACSYLSVGTAD